MWNATSGGTQIQSVALEQVSSIPTNRVASVTTNGGSPVAYEYDEAGNVIDDGAHTYTYDAENRVVAVDSGTTASYSYNHKYHRIKKTIGAATTHYVCHNTGVLSEHNGATGATLVQYVTLGHQQIAKIESGMAYLFLSDTLSGRVVLDTSGNVVGRQGHLPFGEEIGVSGTTDKHKLTSYERDAESGNDHAWHRKYASAAGRFLSSDPYRASGGAENPQSWNRYSYVLNNPINGIDPSGLLYRDPHNGESGALPSCVTGTIGGGEAPVARVSCRIELRSKTKFEIGLHSYIVTTNIVNGVVTDSKLFRADKSPGVFKPYLQASHGDVHRMPDYKDPIVSKHPFPEFRGGTCIVIENFFAHDTDRIEKAKYPDDGLVQNSNSFTFTLLNNLGQTLSSDEVKKFRKGYFFPGWGLDLFRNPAYPPSNR